MPTRLAQIGAWLLAALLAGLLLLPLRSQPPWDFLQFYLAGKLAASGRVAQIYHKPAYPPVVDEIRSAQSRSGISSAYFNRTPYFNRPAFAAFLCIPFASLPFWSAAHLWVLANFALLAALVWKLPVWFPASPPLRPWLAGFLPWIWSIGLGQDTLLLSLLAAYSLHLALQKREIPAGLVLAACAVKPHLLAAMPLALLAGGKRKMAAAFLGGGAVLAAISAAAVGPNGLREWAELLHSRTTDSMPETMGNIRALALHFGFATGLAAGAVTAGCFLFILRQGRLRQSFAAAILAALVLGPHTYLQDYSLLAVAALGAFDRWTQYALLLPWPYFYRREDMLPLTLAALAGLIILAARAAAAPVPDAAQTYAEEGGGADARNSACAAV